MKTWMFALMGLAPNLVAWNYACAGPEGECEKKVVVQRVGGPDGAPAGEWVSPDGKQIKVIAKGTGESADGEFEVITIGGEPGSADADVIVTADVQAGDPAEPGVKKVRVIAKPKTDDPNAAQRGWLGVSIESVPESMAAQLGAQSRGVMIGNVVEGSPADNAGIQANDIVVSLNGQAVSGEVGAAVDLIKARKPGEVVNVGVVRGGQPMTLRVTLGSRADMKEIEWKFDMPHAQVEEQVKTRGKIMMKSPDGQLIVKDLGELDDLKNLPDNIRMFVPQAGSRSTQVFVENGQKTIKMNVEKDGTTTAIEQVDGGAITVRRTDEDGEESVDTYDSADALKAGDADAYELYSQAGQSVYVHVDGDHPHIFMHGDGDFEWTEDAGQWQIHLEESLAEAKEAYKAAMEELHQNLAELKNDGTFDVQKLHEALSAQGKGMGHAMAFSVGKPKHRFEVGVNGSIEVSIRKGDSEMTQSFANEADLAKRRPDLYEKYQDIKAADEE